jgi:hypothetical protein
MSWETATTEKNNKRFTIKILWKCLIVFTPKLLNKINILKKIFVKVQNDLSFRPEVLETTNHQNHQHETA